ncbi:MAG: ion transporter [Gallionellaceae bacterium]|nr:ion transporter [Gallionellaceae bacterium]
MSLPPLRQRVFHTLGGGADRLGRAISLGLVTLIVVNVLAVIAGSVAAVQLRYGPWLDAFEAFSVLVFTLEYGLRLWACREDPRYASALVGRLRFAATPLAIVDLLAVLPALITWMGVDLRFLRLLRLARMLRLAKLGRYSRAVQTMGLAVSRKREELVLSLMLMLLMLVLASSLMYLAEHDSQPEAFSSIPAAMWWGVMTLTTVGYGDMYPGTLLGKIMGAVVAIMGIGLFALPVGILGSAFIELSRPGEQAPAGVCPHCGKPLPPPPAP